MKSFFILLIALLGSGTAFGQSSSQDSKKIVASVVKLAEKCEQDGKPLSEGKVSRGRFLLYVVDIMRDKILFKKLVVRGLEEKILVREMVIHLKRHKNVVGGTAEGMYVVAMPLPKKKPTNK